MSRSSRTGRPTESDSSSRTNGNGAAPRRNGTASAPRRNGTASAPRRNGTPAAPRRKPSPRAARKLFRFDRGLGVRFVAGADEAGRGCLAGPLVAAAVLFDLERLGPGEVRALGALNDSKQHTPDGRAELFPVILRIATKVAIVSRCAPGIDARGLHKTNLAALRDALLKVARDGCICLSDGFPVAALGYDQRAVIDGDAKSAAIAAASVIAKETRDRYMRRADSAHPGWEFAQHVGYSTPEHREAIERLGVSPLHRLSFQSMAYQQLALAEAAALDEVGVG
ncbi:MAG TPA: ribonuclease HII [Solirubrobacteraceae bacterium]|nr:ribonuclease HII [Solirubrobacteraceae bacterium]